MPLSVNARIGCDWMTAAVDIVPIKYWRRDPFSATILLLRFAGEGTWNAVDGWNSIASTAVDRERMLEVSMLGILEGG